MAEFDADLKDETITPTLSANDTPPSGRLLAPTSSSVAKATFLPSHRKPVPAPSGSPAFRPPSRTGSTSSPSTSSPLTSKWASRVAHRVAASEQSNMHTHRDDAEREETSLGSSASNARIFSIDSGTPSPSGSLARDKPLPSRPVASVISSGSPSKDGRSLIDASEQPLHFSIHGNRHEWPVLTPRSVSAPERAQATDKINRVTPSSIPRKVSGTGNIVSTPTYRASRPSGMGQSLTVRDSKASGITERSSDRSFVSAEELAGEESHSLQRQPRSKAGVDETSNVAVSENSITHEQSEDLIAPIQPVRRQSLHPADSPVELSTPANDRIAQQSKALDDSARDIATPELRNQSPSLANFSRPRPGSTRISRLPSLSRSITTPTHRQRTASRIPVADCKKATLVDIPSQAASAQPISTTSETSPSFGARQLVAPNALAILDQGTKRRLQRVDTNGSTVSTTSSSTGILDLDAPRANSPDHTSGQSSSDDDEITTPVGQPHRPFPGLTKKPSREFGLVHESDLQSTELDVPRSRKAPPSKSRFTGPLQTIHSQAVLPVYTDNGQSLEESAPAARFSGIAHGLTDVRAARSILPRKQSRQRSVSLDNVQSPAGDPEHNDEHRRQLGNDVNTHLHRTLSILEGQGTPPSVAVDNDRLQEMFGLLKRGAENPSKNSSLIANAAAADMFLGQSATGSPNAEKLETERFDRNETSAGVRASHDSKSIESFVQVASKWSNSTPSGPAFSTETPYDNPAPSIGYPSATSRPSAATSSIFQDSAKSGVAANSRNSSPTLGFGKQVADKTHERGKNTRESTLARANFARMTAASASKKIGGNSTSTNTSIRKPENVQRGRASLLAPSGIRSSPAKGMSHGLNRSAVSDSKLLDKTNNPRSRSKSRIVLDKINGFFSHKRDRKTEHPEPPPMPTLTQTKVTDSLTSPSLHASTGAEVKMVKSIPQSASTMTMAPTAQELRSSSRATDGSETSLDSDILMNGDVGGNVLTLAEKLVSKAMLQSSAKRKERMLSFAMVLNDAMLNVREAKISAEMARQMADKAELSYRKTKKGVDMLQRLASSLVQSTVRH